MMTKQKKPKEFMKEVLTMSKMLETNFKDLELCSSFEVFNEMRNSTPELAYQMHSWICHLRDQVEQQAALIAAIIYDLQSAKKDTETYTDKVGNTFLKVSTRMKELNERLKKLEQENKS